MTTTKPTKLSRRRVNRKLDVKLAAAEGLLITRERENDEPCPGCGDKYDEVYQWAEGHRMEGDDRWFCFCGYTESPDKSGDFDGWRNP